MFKFDRHYIADIAVKPFGIIAVVPACLIILILGHIIYLFKFPFYIIKSLKKGK